MWLWIGCTETTVSVDMMSNKPKMHPKHAYQKEWYWSYEYSDYVNESGESIEFDSYMIPESDLELGQSTKEVMKINGR